MGGRTVKPKYWHELTLGPRILLDYGDLTISTPENIYFECTKCGNCSRSPFIADVSDADISRLATALKKKPSEFSVEAFGKKRLIQEMELYISPHGNTPVSVGRCTFLDGENLCSIYENRPPVCRTFPFRVDAVDGLLRAEFVFEKRPDYSPYCPGFFYGRPTKEMYEGYVEGMRMRKV